MKYRSLLPLMMTLTACTVGPDYVRPDAPVSTAYKELGDWKPSQPADDVDRGAWWDVYHDTTLDTLERQVEISNQTLKVSQAAYEQAVSVARAARASLYPSLSTSPSAKRSASTNALGKSTLDNTYTLPVTGSWDLDVWGSIKRTVEADEATAQATAGDLASAKLSAQSQLAIDYFELRSEDQLSRILTAAVDAYGQSLRITQNQYKAGVASRADVAQAETQLKATQASLINVNVLRSQLEHAIAVLIGKPPADFTIEPAPLAVYVPVMPASVPSALLERRPDIAAAERRVAAANAEIGVATAAFYPDLSLSGTLEYANTSLDGLFKSANRIWSFGPQLSQFIYDGGLRSNQLDESNAAWRGTVATFRQTVLTAFQQVEDNLTALKVLEREEDVQNAAVTSAREAERLILNQYKAGTVAYTSVVTAQTAALSDDETALTIHENRLIASVNLIEALGGGWTIQQLPKIE